MILLREPKVLFLKARKVAGTSFEIALSKFAGKNDVITPITPEDERIRKELGFRGAQNYRFSCLDVFTSRLNYMLKAINNNLVYTKFYNHISAKEARKRLGVTLWDECLKVAIARNPFDRIVSHYFWIVSNPNRKQDFENWMRSLPRLINNNNEQYLIDGENVVDFYIRFESLEEDIMTLEDMKPELRGLWDIFSGLSAKSGFRPKSASTADFFSDKPDLVAAVRFFNREIIERFGYDFE